MTSHTMEPDEGQDRRHRDEGCHGRAVVHPDTVPWSRIEINEAGARRHRASFRPGGMDSPPTVTHREARRGSEPAKGQHPRQGRSRDDS